MQQNQPVPQGGQQAQGGSAQGGQQIQIKVEDKVLKGQYATHAQVAHTNEEFILDFMTILPPVGQLTARIIVNPSHYKRLVRAMQENLQRYEDQFGTIQLAVVPDQKIGFKID